MTRLAGAVRVDPARGNRHVVSAWVSMRKGAEAQICCGFAQPALRRYRRHAASRGVVLPTALPVGDESNHHATIVSIRPFVAVPARRGDRARRLTSRLR